MSRGPSTLGIIITSSLCPISVTIVVMSSSTHGDSRALTRVQSWVSPSWMSRPTVTSPARAASLRSTGTASSRLPSRMSTVGAMSGTLATIFSLEKSRKWIIRDGRTGISRTGSGASIASGWKKSRGLRTAGTLRHRAQVSVVERLVVVDVVLDARDPPLLEARDRAEGEVRLGAAGVPDPVQVDPRHDELADRLDRFELDLEVVEGLVQGAHVPPHLLPAVVVQLLVEQLPGRVPDPGR